MSDSNAHRKGKRNFQAFLPPSEAKAVEEAKRLLEVSTDRELVIKLIEFLKSKPRELFYCGQKKAPKQQGRKGHSQVGGRPRHNGEEGGKSRSAVSR